jgi:predicted nucleotidyltransferase
VALALFGYHLDRVSAGSIDLSGWERREECRRAEVRALLDRVDSLLGPLAEVLRSFGLREAYVFGSIAAGRPRPGSDLDVAVAGCAPERFYRLAALVEQTVAMPVDVVDLDRAPAGLAEAIRGAGRRILP